MNTQEYKSEGEKVKFMDSDSFYHLLQESPLFIDLGNSTGKQFQKKNHRSHSFDGVPINSALNYFQNFANGGEEENKTSTPLENQVKVNFQNSASKVPQMMSNEIYIYLKVEEDKKSAAQSTTTKEDTFLSQKRSKSCDFSTIRHEICLEKEQEMIQLSEIQETQNYLQMPENKHNSSTEIDLQNLQKNYSFDVGLDKNSISQLNEDDIRYISDDSMSFYRNWSDFEVCSDNKERFQQVNPVEKNACTPVLSPSLKIPPLQTEDFPIKTKEIELRSFIVENDFAKSEKVEIKVKQKEEFKFQAENFKLQSQIKTLDEKIMALPLTVRPIREDIFEDYEDVFSDISNNDLPPSRIFFEGDRLNEMLSNMIHDVIQEPPDNYQGSH